MKKTISYIFSFAGTGIAIGIPVTLVCMTLIGGFNAVLGEFITWTIASALFGLFSGIMFRTDSELSLPLSLLIHCVGCLAIAVSAATICGYADNFTTLITAILPVFIIVYIAVYFLCFMLMKMEEKKINKELNHE